MQRRDFLASMGVAGVAPAIIHAQGSIESRPQQRIIQLALVVGSTQNPLLPLLAKAAAIQLYQASEAQAKQLSARLQDLNSKITGAKLGSEVRDVLASRLSREIGLAKEVDDCIATGRLLPTVTGFIETYKPDFISLADSAAAEMSRVLKQDVSRANGAYDALSQALIGAGRAELPSISSFSNVLGAKNADLLNQAQITVSTATTLADGLVVDMTNKVEGLKADAFKRPGEILAHQLGVDLSAPRLTPDMQGFRAGASAIQGVLTLVGASKQAKDVANAVQYVEAGVQVFQAVSMLAAAGSGWGLVAGASGLLNGCGGMAAFSAALGGGGAAQAEAAAQKRHEEVMAAIREVHDMVKTEFANLNQRVDEIFKQLGILLDEIKGLKYQSNQILQEVKLVSLKVDDLTFRLELSDHLSRKHTTEWQHKDCAALSANKQVTGGLMTQCRRQYSDTSLELFEYPWMLPFNGLEAAQALLVTMSKIDPDAGRPDSVSWSYANALRKCLDFAGVKGLPKPAFEPALVMMLEGYTDLRVDNPSEFDRFDKTGSPTTRKQVDALRKSGQQHAAFVSRLRSAGLSQRKIAGKDLLLGSAYDDMGKLFAGYEKHLSAFESEVQLLMNDGLVQFVEAYAASQISGPFDVRLGSLQEPGYSIPFLNAADFGPGNVTTFLRCPTCGPDSGNSILAIEIVSMTLSKPLDQLREDARVLQLKADAARARNYTDDNSGLSESDRRKHGVPAGRAPDGFLLQGHSCEISVWLYGTEIYRFVHNFTVHEGSQTDKSARDAALGPALSVTKPLAYLAAQQGGADKWPFDGFVGKRALPTLMPNLALQAPLAQIAREVHVKQITEWHGQVAQRSLQTVLRKISQLGGATSGKLTTLPQMEQLALQIRAMCHLGHEEAMFASDTLQALFNGDASHRLVDTPLLIEWVKKPQMVPTNPTQYEMLDQAARSRFEALKVAIAFMMDSTARRGPPLAFERAWRGFNEEFPESKYPPLN
ncbi:hypothetical protein, partial [Pelomonas sp. KK5]|uniref:hypothetical protein n=1 Tax=Pelomonas sp. KK5 TaxID=1855730 RepID=UPI001301B30F